MHKFFSRKTEIQGQFVEMDLSGKRWVRLTLISKGENQCLLAWKGSCLTVSCWHISEASCERSTKLVLLMDKKLRGNYTFLKSRAFLETKITGWFNLSVLSSLLELACSRKQHQAGCSVQCSASRQCIQN